MFFTILLWVLSVLIYISNKDTKVNKWFSISMFFISLGTLKEFLYYDFWLQLSNDKKILLTDINALTIYNIITALLYSFASPIFLYSTTFLFKNLTYKTKKNVLLKTIMFIPGIILLFRYPAINFKVYQHSGHIFWYTYSIYNISYGIILTAMQLYSIYSENDKHIKRQKKFVVMIIFPPLWFYLITIFVIHSLWIEPLLKIWKANVIIVFVVIVMYVFFAFREGILGLKLHGENYKWNDGLKIINDGAQYTSHILKNELTKIEWSANSLEKKYANDFPEELAIIKRSAEHMRQFVEKTKLYSKDVSLFLEYCNVISLVEHSIILLKDQLGHNITFEIDCAKDAKLFCDKDHTIEVLNNLILNGVEAMKKEGKIYISLIKDTKKHMNALVIRDTGCGISELDKNKIFEPYFTTKKSNKHFGLGLAYVLNVMKKHGGYIEVFSKIDEGTVFKLYFPLK